MLRRFSDSPEVISVTVVEKVKLSSASTKATEKDLGFSFRMGLYCLFGPEVSEATVGPSYVLAQIKVKFFFLVFSVKKKIQKIQNGLVVSFVAQVSDVTGRK